MFPDLRVFICKLNKGHFVFHSTVDPLWMHRYYALSGENAEYANLAVLVHTSL